MKHFYGGYEITVTREQALGGWDQIQYVVRRLRDGWFFKDGFYMGDYGSVREVAREMKGYVDVLLHHPELMDDEDLPPELREQREAERRAQEEDEDEDEDDGEA